MIVKISLNDIRKGQSDIRNFHKKLELAMDDIVEELAEIGCENVQNELDMYGIGSGLLSDGTTVERSTKRTMKIVSRAMYKTYNGDIVDYAPFVEFGTGIFTEGGATEPWQYVDALDPYDEEGNLKFKTTWGMEARPYMANTADYLNEVKRDVAEKHIRGIKID